MRGRAAICILLDAVIAAASIMCVILTWIYVEGFYLQIALTAVWAASAVGIIGREISCCRKRKKKKETTTCPHVICLLGENDKTIQGWPLEGQIGLLIGKENPDYTCLIDLTDSSYSDYIDPIHMSLNYTDAGWWAQDLSTRGGSAIWRDGKEIFLAPGHPVLLQCGDLLELSRSVRLAVR